MLGDDYDQQREELQRNVERGEHELREAVDDLKRAVNRPLAVVNEITRKPLPWLLCGVLVGIWLGARRGHGTQPQL